MEAPRILSQEQRQTLESIFLFFRTTRPLLSLICAKPGIEQSDRLQLEGTIRLARLSEQRLVTHFPELQSIADQWKNRGGL